MTIKPMNILFLPGQFLEDDTMYYCLFKWSFPTPMVMCLSVQYSSIPAFVPHADTVKMPCQPYDRYSAVCGPRPLSSCTQTVRGLVSKLLGCDESWTFEYLEHLGVFGAYLLHLLSVNCGTLSGIWHVCLVSQEDSLWRKNRMQEHSLYFWFLDNCLLILKERSWREYQMPSLPHSASSCCFKK